MNSAQQKAVATIAEFWQGGYWGAVSRADILRIERAFKILKGEPAIIYEFKAADDKSWVEISKSEYDCFVRGPQPGYQVQVRTEDAD